MFRLTSEPCGSNFCVCRCSRQTWLETDLLACTCRIFDIIVILRMLNALGSRLIVLESCIDSFDVDLGFAQIRFF
jgi:hypothetical protein